MDWHLIGLGAQTVIFLAGVYGLVLRADFNSKAVKDDIMEMKEELHQLAEVIVIQAVQTSKIENLTSQVVMLQRNLEDLRRGDGFVRSHRGVDGEYGS